MCRCKNGLVCSASQAHTRGGARCSVRAATRSRRPNASGDSDARSALVRDAAGPRRDDVADLQHTVLGQAQTRFRHRLQHVCEPGRASLQQTTRPGVEELGARLHRQRAPLIVGYALWPVRRCLSCT